MTPIANKPVFTAGRPTGYCVLVGRPSDLMIWDSLLLTKLPTRTSGAFRFCEFCRKNKEPTSGLEPLSCSLRVITQALQGLARGCKSRISRGLSLLRVAVYCTVLRSRWHQNGINRGIASSRSYSLVHASEVRPAPHEGRHYPTHPRPLLPLDALDGPQHRRRDGRSVGLGDLLLPFDSPRWWLGA